MIEKDIDGTWEVEQKSACKVRLLVKPSKAFKDKQALNPPVEDDKPTLEDRVKVIEGKLKIVG